MLHRSNIKKNAELGQVINLRTFKLSNFPTEFH